MGITGGTWKKFEDSAIVSDGEHPDPVINTPGHRESYDGALIAKSIYNPDDLALFLAAPKMLEALRSVMENIDNHDYWGFDVEEIQNVIDLAEGKG